MTSNSGKEIMADLQNVHEFLLKRDAFDISPPPPKVLQTSFKTSFRGPMVSAPFTTSFFLDGCGKRNNVPCLLQQRHVDHAPAERERALQEREQPS